MSSDDEGRRDERRERRRQRVHDRLANLIEENRMLTLLTQEDAEEIQKMRYDVETSEIEKRRLVAVNEQQDTIIRQLQDQILHLEHCKFVADVQAKTIEQQDRSIKELMEENKLQSAQTQMDSETIRTLHRQVNEVTLERDRLATRVGKAVQGRDEAEAEVKMLLVHADELRNSNVQLAAKMIALEERVQDFEEEDYADFFTRVSRRDIANGKVNGADAQLLMIKRKGTPPTEKRLEELAAKAGITIEAMTAAEKLMPVAVRVADVSPNHHHGGGMMELSPEQLRLLGQSNTSVSPKKFSAYALQAQFGISPESSKKPKQQPLPASNSPSSSSDRRDSKEFSDLTQRTTDLPLPKSSAQPSREAKTLSSPQQLHDDSDAPELSSSLTDNNSLAQSGGGSVATFQQVKASTRKRSVLRVVSPREEELLRQQQQQQQADLASAAKLAREAQEFAASSSSVQKSSHHHHHTSAGSGSSSSHSGTTGSSTQGSQPKRSGNVSPSYTYLVITPERHAAQGAIVLDAPVMQPAAAIVRPAPGVEVRRRADDDDRTSSGVKVETRRPAAVSAPADPPPLMTNAVVRSKQGEQSGAGDVGGRSPAHNVDSTDVTRALPMMGGGRKLPPPPLQEIPMIHVQPSSTTSSHHSSHHNSHNHHRRPLASLPVRDALSGSIVSGGEGVEIGAVDGDDDNDGVLSGGRLLSPNAGVDSDSSDDDDALDSPSKLSVERGTLLREQMDVQRLSHMNTTTTRQQEASAARRHLSSGGEVISSQSSLSNITNKNGGGAYAGDAHVHAIASGGSSANAHSKASGGGGATFKTMKERRQEQHDLRPAANDQPPPNAKRTGGGQKLSPTTAAAPSAAVTGGGKQQGRNNNVNLLTGSSKFLPPISGGASSSMPPQSPGYLANRPSTCPLVVEAVYGERGGSSDEEKMYLVKFVSVESEQWTSAANMDAECEPLKEWKRAKAKMRQQAQQRLAGKAASPQ